MHTPGWKFKMKAYFITKTGKLEDSPLELKEVKIPIINDSEILVKVFACGICHTELDEIEGRIAPKIPVIPGHEIIGEVVEKGALVKRFEIGDRVGIAWINTTCGRCRFCKSGLENLCTNFKTTGCDVDGGYAEYTKINENYAYKIPLIFSSEEAAPLLCAGAIGLRAVKLAGIKNGEVVGLFGFGASGHIAFQVIRYLYPKSKIFVFTRQKQDSGSLLAKELGGDWIGQTGETPAIKLNKAIDTTPKGEVIIEALKTLDRGGRLIINSIRKEASIPSISYELLWEEKEIKSVANITRKDVEDFLKIAEIIPIHPEVSVVPFEKVNEALLMIKKGGVKGALVIKIF
jgi:propanol-preferring alcohol dehydrogenase